MLLGFAAPRAPPGSPSGQGNVACIPMRILHFDYPMVPNGSAHLEATIPLLVCVLDMKWRPPRAIQQFLMPSMKLISLSYHPTTIRDEPRQMGLPLTNGELKYIVISINKCKSDSIKQPCEFDAFHLNHLANKAHARAKHNLSNVETYDGESKHQLDQETICS